MPRSIREPLESATQRIGISTRDVDHGFAASNSCIQAWIADLALSIFSCVGWLWIRLESATPTLARASFRVPPLDIFKIASCLALVSVARTFDNVAGDNTLIAALAALPALNSSLMLIM